MNFTSVKEESSNIASVAGKVCSKLTKSHQVEGENFYEFKVEVDRLSKIKDIIPVTISERTVDVERLKEGLFVELKGEYRSYNKLLNDKSKLILHLFAKELQVLSEEKNLNEVKLTGFVCKEPIYRKTPFDREICDVLLAVNRVNYHKSNYIPCIMWGRNARFMANQTIGCKVELLGRIQSREYSKINELGESEIKTAYEVSCQRISLLSNLTNLQPKDAKSDSQII
ncbi:MAG: single-stranded DNA-binding protein [Clostridia bacterium]|nr:single-stranded DNA-binding protein [Clostridia bacterium]